MYSTGNRGGPRGNAGGFSHKAPILATDMRCYFECPEGFKKDYDLRLHIKLRHKNENETELRKAYQACEEEIALTRRTASTFQCALCPKQMIESGGFADHIKNKHGINWNEYKDQYGRCEVESASFECKICGRVIKYDRKIIQIHMKHVHRITWEQYLDRIRKMRKGEMAGDLPDIEVFECKICNVSVKYIFKGNHLKRVHKITEGEYVELFQDELMNNGNLAAHTPTNLQQNNVSRENSLRPASFAPSVRLTGEVTRPQPDAWRNMSGSSSQNKFDDDGTIDYNEDMNMQEQDQKPLMMDLKPQINDFPENSPFSERSSPTPSKFLLKPPKTDIQDSHNKKCSSCNIPFETRRLFIEHCTVAHKMKFKTASGATIAAPSSQRGMPSPPPQSGWGQSIPYTGYMEPQNINSQHSEFTNGRDLPDSENKSFLNDQTEFGRFES